MRLRVLGAPGSALQQTGVQTSAGFVPIGEVGEFTPEEQARVTSILALQEVDEDEPVYGSSEHEEKVAEETKEAEGNTAVDLEEKSVPDGDPLPEPDEKDLPEPSPLASGVFGSTYHNDEEVK